MGVKVKALHLCRHSRSLLQNDERAIQVLLVECCTRVHAQVTQRVKSWQLYFSVQSLVSKNVVQTRHEVVQILVHPLHHASRQITDDAASQLRAVVVLALQSVLYVTPDLLNFNLVSQAHDQTLERNESVLSDLLRLLEQLDDHLDDVLSEWLFNQVANFNENHLQQTTKQILQVRRFVVAQRQSLFQALENRDHELVGYRV